MKGRELQREGGEGRGRMNQVRTGKMVEGRKGMIKVRKVRVGDG